MSTRVFANNAAGKLNANILAGDTSLTLQAGQGALFPNPTGGDYFTFSLINNSNVIEIAKCTARAGDVFTIVRGQEGTSAIGFTAGDRVELRLTAAGITNKQDRAQVATISGNITLTGADASQEKIITAAANVVLPLSSDAKLQAGDWIDFKVRTGGGVTLAPQGADLLDGVGSGSPIALVDRDSLRAVLQGAGNWNINFRPSTPIAVAVCNGRLTLTTGLPITTSDVLAAGTVYFTPFGGNRVSTFNGASWSTSVFSEKSVAVPATTNKNFDIFIVDGTLALETVDWTDDLNRATNISLQDGIYVKATDATRRYLGTCRTTGVSGKCEDSAAKRFLWNYYNRVQRKMFVKDTTATWNYTTATWRQANGAAANQLDMVIGVSENLVKADVAAGAMSSVGNVDVNVGIGIDSTSVNSADLTPQVRVAVANVVSAPCSKWSGYPGIGRHFLAWLEISFASGTTTWQGDSDGNLPSGIQSGITGEIWG